MICAQKLLGKYSRWLLSKNADDGKVFMEQFSKRWHALVDVKDETQSENCGLLGNEEEFNKKVMDNYGLLGKGGEFSMRVMENFSASAASTLFEQEIREVVSYFYQASLNYQFHFSLSSLFCRTLVYFSYNSFYLGQELNCEVIKTSTRDFPLPTQPFAT